MFGGGRNKTSSCLVGFHSLFASSRLTCSSRLCTYFAELDFTKTPNLINQIAPHKPIDFGWLRWLQFVPILWFILQVWDRFLKCPRFPDDIIKSGVRLRLFFRFRLSVYCIYSFVSTVSTRRRHAIHVFVGFLLGRLLSSVEMKLLLGVVIYLPLPHYTTPC